MATAAKPRKAARARKTLTPDERKEREAALKASQAQALTTLLDSDEWARYLRAGRLLRSYSAMNTLLILVQCPEATRVAGFNTWKALGRRVVSGKGSGLKIWGAPFSPTIWVEQAAADPNAVILDRDGSKVKIRAPWRRYPIVTVFDLSQTEGETLPDVVPLLHSDDDDENAHAVEVSDKVRAWLAAEGWTVRTAEPLPPYLLESQPKGTTDHTRRVIEVRGDLSPTQTAKTLLHEAAHSVLHGNDEWAPLSEYHRSAAHRGVAEVQAEGTAYMVAGMLGLDTSAYSTGYVANWARHAAGSDDADAIAALVEKSAAAVRFAMNRIMDAIEGPAGEPVAVQPGATAEAHDLAA